MAAITTFTTVAFIFTDALISTQTCILATLTRSLTITTFLALTAPLAPRFGGKILFILTKLVLEIESGGN